jgi:hypothetical protein
MGVCDGAEEGADAGGVAKLRQAEALIRQGTAAADTVRVIALTEPS